MPSAGRILSTTGPNCCLVLLPTGIDFMNGHCPPACSMAIAATFSFFYIDLFSCIVNTTKDGRTRVGLLEISQWAKKKTKPAEFFILCLLHIETSYKMGGVNFILHFTFTLPTFSFYAHMYVLSNSGGFMNLLSKSANKAGTHLQKTAKCHAIFVCGSQTKIAWIGRLLGSNAFAKIGSGSKGLQL